MRIQPAFAAISVLFLTSRPVSGQRPDSPAVTRSSIQRARQIVQQALAQLQPAGGPVQSIVIEASGYEDLSAEMQGLSPGRETRRDHRELLVVDIPSGAVAYERRTPRNDFSLRWRRFILGPEQRGVVDLANGFSSMRPVRVSEADRAAYRRRVPHFLLLEVLADSARLRWTGRSTRSGRSVDLITAPLPNGDQLTLAFDQERRLQRFEWRLEFPGLGDTTVAIEYIDWSSHERLGRFPGGHRVLVGNRVYQSVRYQRIRVDDPAAAELLRVPAELDAARRPAPMQHSASTPPMPEPGSVSQVADGVYLVQDLSGFNLMFVDLGGEVLVAEAPAAHPFLDAIPATNYSRAAPLSRQYLELVRRTLPGLPIRYLVASHHHSDHLGGVREFIDAGATIMVPAGDSGLVERISQRPHTIKSGRSSGARARIESVRGRRTVSGSARAVEIIQVGANPHTEDNLLIWIPAGQILFQGDLFYHRQGEAPPPDRETMNRFFAGWIARQGLSPARIYGTHNQGFATMADLPRP